MTNATPPVLQDLAHRDAQAALAGGAPVYLPVNPVEYHGPHLPLHNDRLITAGLIGDLHARLQGGPLAGPLLVAAELEVGVDPVPGPGTRAVSCPVVSRLVRDACLALADLGARRVVLMTFHGSPMHSVALEAGVTALRARGVPVVNPMNALLDRVLRGGAPGDRERLGAAADALGPEIRAALEDDTRFDFHAGLMETSLTLHYAPASVSPAHATLPPCPPVRPVAALRAASRAAATLGRRALAEELAFAALGLGWYGLRPFPGYTGQPHLASAALGAALAEVAVDQLVEAVEAVLLGGAPSPPPFLGWLRHLTLGGRLAARGTPATAAP